MPETKWTPGPWKVTFFPQQRTAAIETVDQGTGYRHLTNDLPMQAMPGAPTVEIEGVKYCVEAVAAAHLMASAPELYAILAECIRQATRPMGDGGINLDTIAEARAVLAKAKGEVETCNRQP